jgi:O-antigen/teichoic acid export membrane protein
MVVNSVCFLADGRGSPYVGFPPVGRIIIGTRFISGDARAAGGSPLSLRVHAGRLLTCRPLWTLADQGMVSVGNFLSGVILARHLPKTGYGAYALLLETMLFLNTLQSAVVTYPMSVRGATHEPHQVRRFASASLWITLALLPILGLAMGVGVFFGVNSLGSTADILPLAVCAVGAMLLWQLQETLRRSLMSELRFMACIPGDALSYLGQAILLWMLADSGKLTLPWAFVIIGATSGLAIVLQSLQIGLVRLRLREIAEIARDFWKLGNWTLLANLAGLITTIGYTWTLKIFRGLDATAAYAAMIVPLKLANPILIGIGNLLVPAVAKAAKRGGLSATIRIAVRYGLLGAGIIFSYYGLVAAFPHMVLAEVFGKHSPYLLEATPLRLYLINMCVMYVEFVLLAWLLGLGESRANGVSQIFYATLTLVVALPATALYGVYGLIAGNLVAATLCVLVQLFLLRRALGVVIGAKGALVAPAVESPEQRTAA